MKKDHREISEDLKIYFIDDEIGQGLPIWLPNGSIIIEELEKLAKEYEYKAGYKRVKTPHIAKESLYIKSGHLQHYKDGMFPPMELDGEKYYLKAMNCPHHHKIFAFDKKSYKDLPYRIAEYGTCYRYEQSGSLIGIMRSRCLNMNDAHIYCSNKQFSDEFKNVINLYLSYFKIFNISDYKLRLSLHEPSKLGDKYVNEPSLWLETESMIREVLINLNIPFIEVADEAAFYGPKIDVQIFSSIGREFTISTNQVDFCSGKNFSLEFTNEFNEKEIPLIIHRAPLGTHERFIGFLLEHYSGKLPLWLSPIQLNILSVSDKFNDFCNEFKNKLFELGIRVELNDRSERINRKIMDSDKNCIPYSIVVGEKEINSDNFVLRKQGGDKISLSFNELEKYLLDSIRYRI